MCHAGGLKALAEKTDGGAWDANNIPRYEASVLPTDYNYSGTFFAMHGTYASYATTEHPVAHGYEAGAENWPYPFGGDVYNVSALAGWTCGNLIATAADTARYVRALYGPEHSVVSRESVSAMTRLSLLGPGSWNYGMGTMELPGSTSESPYYGHGGCTYGFNAYVGYNPVHDFGLALATNLELESYYTYRNLDDIHANVYQAVSRAFASKMPESHPEELIV